MGGRGKGGKGLGKGGAKRHRKVLRDNIQVELFCYCKLYYFLFRVSQSQQSVVWHVVAV
jgi:hypothetical protein